MKKYTMGLFLVVCAAAQAGGVKQIWNATGNSNIEVVVVPEQGFARSKSIAPGNRASIEYPSTYAKEIILRNTSRPYVQETQIQDWHELNENEFFTVQQRESGHLFAHAHPNYYVQPVHHNNNMIQIFVDNNTPHTYALSYVDHQGKSQYIVLQPGEQRYAMLPANVAVHTSMKVDGQEAPVVAKIPAGRLHNGSHVQVNFEKDQRQQLDIQGLGAFEKIDGVSLAYLNSPFGKHDRNPERLAPRRHLLGA